MMMLYAGGPVNCDGCGKEFTPQPQEREHPLGEEQYFRCPHCERNYRIALTSYRGLELRQEIASENRKQSRFPTRKRHARIRQLRAELKKEVTSTLSMKEATP